MKTLPLPLVPCWVCLMPASFLVGSKYREEWREEWQAELWHRWNRLRHTEEWMAGAAWKLFAISTGCFRDAWFCFGTDENRWNDVRAQLRAPHFCAAAIFAAALLLGWGSGYFRVTRAILDALPNSKEARIAFISRTGRMQAIRNGIPNALAAIWARDSRLLEAMAACSIVPSPEASVDGHGLNISALQASGNLFDVIGETVPAAARERVAAGEPVALLSYSFWQNELRSGRKLVGRRLEHNHRSYAIAGVLPARFWFVAPSVQVYELTEKPASSENMLVVRVKAGVEASGLEAELEKIAGQNEIEFTRTAPHVLFLREALATPFWLFGSSLWIAAILAGIGHGFRLRNSDYTNGKRRFGKWPWWLFLVAKMSVGLALLFVAGIEIVIGLSHQMTTEPLGGPALLWFYTAGCSGVLFAAIADQRSRCRVCLQCLAFPVRVGCPGCLFLDWSGTELLCPDGHGMLYVPHHIACWDEAGRWVGLEI